MPKVLRSREITAPQRWVPESVAMSDPVSLAEAQVAQLLLAAQSQAAQIVADAQADAARLRQEACAAGQQAGEQGRAAAIR